MEHVWILLTARWPFPYRVSAGEEISARLQAIHRDPGKIDLIINSHFHFDHVGGNALIPDATLLVQRREWEAGMDPEMAARRGFNRGVISDLQAAWPGYGPQTPCSDLLWARLTGLIFAQSPPRRAAY